MDGSVANSSKNNKIKHVYTTIWSLLFTQRFDRWFLHSELLAWFYSDLIAGFSHSDLIAWFHTAIWSLFLLYTAILSPSSPEHLDHFWNCGDQRNCWFSLCKIASLGKTEFASLPDCSPPAMSARQDPKFVARDCSPPDCSPPAMSARQDPKSVARDCSPPGCSHPAINLKA